MQTTCYHFYIPFRTINLAFGKRLLLFIVLFASMSCQGQPKQKSNKYLKQFYEKRAKKYLIKDERIRASFAISDSGITLYNVPRKTNTKKTLSSVNREVEYHLPWKNLKAFQEWIAAQPLKTWEFYQKKQLPSLTANLMKPASFVLNSNKNKPLTGLKVALDPGHIAGSLKEAKNERKFVDVTLANGKRISFFESELAWYTCKVLADMLEEKGAKVILTRNKFNLMALDSTYTQVFKHYQKQQKKLGKNVADSQKWRIYFKKFRKADFNARIDKINAFKPHLTMIVHYNVDGANAPWNKVTPQNNCMAFVAGSFMNNELSKPEHRFNFLRLLLTKDIETSTTFCTKMLDAIVTKLKVPILPKKSNQPFINRACMPTPSPGVYARNLSLARKVYGTLCFIEPLYQENKQEILMLGKRNYDFKGTRIPKRVAEVAQAYYHGIINYLKK